MLNANSTQLYADIIYRKPDLLNFDNQLKKAYVIVYSPYDAFAGLNLCIAVLHVNSSISNLNYEKSLSLSLGLQGVSIKTWFPG